jgi:hypothetical protein
VTVEGHFKSDIVTIQNRNDSFEDIQGIAEVAGYMNLPTLQCQSSSAAFGWSAAKPDAPATECPVATEEVLYRKEEIFLIDGVALNRLEEVWVRKGIKKWCATHGSTFREK